MRAAYRQLTRAPGFALLVGLTLALGMGASTAVFSLVHAALLRPLPYAEPERLVRLWAYDRERDIVRATLSYPRTVLLRAQTDVFEDFAASGELSLTLTGRGQAEQLEGHAVSASFFRVLGIAPPHGRGFLPADDEPGAPAVAIVSHGFAQRRLGGAAASVGQMLLLDGRPHTVVGVLPRDFAFPYTRAEVWLPRPGETPLYSPQQIRDGAAYLNATARLRPGATVRDAQTRLDALGERYRRENPGAVDGRVQIEAVTFADELVGGQRRAVWLLFDAVVLVHLIACVNVAALMLARFAGRQHETAMRAALGATRGRLVREFTLEAALLALAGGAVGTVLAFFATGLGAAWVRAQFARPLDFSAGGAALAFAFALTLLTGLAVGFVPARAATPRSLTAALKSGTRRRWPGRAAVRRTGCSSRARSRSRSCCS